MSEPSACSRCGTALPEAGAACTACGTRVSAQLKLTAAMAVVSLDAPPSAAGGQEGDASERRPETESAQRRAAAHPSQTDVTLFNLADAARAAVEAARKIEDERAAATAAQETARKAAVDEAARRVIDRQQRALLGWPQVARGIMVAGGVVLLALFALDSPIIPALAGLQLALSIYYFVGGIVLASGALLPLPARLRAAFATLVGAVPLLMAGPLVGGVGGWRGLAAAAVVLVLPGALLLRARVTGSRAARLLVGAAVALALAVYLVPYEGVVPLRAVWGLLTSGSLTDALIGVFFLLPLGLASLTLTAFAGQASTGYGNLWACLVLLNASAAVVIAGQLREELTLVHLGVGLLAAGSAAAVGVADLLDLDPQAG